MPEMADAIGMTVGALRKVLEELPDDRPVVLEKDAEGNGYSPLAEAVEGMYEPDSTWSGQVYPTPEQVAADAQMTDEDLPPDEAIRVLVLGPVN